MSRNQGSRIVVFFDGTVSRFIGAAFSIFTYHAQSHGLIMSHGVRLLGFVDMALM